MKNIILYCSIFLLVACVTFMFGYAPTRNAILGTGGNATDGKSAYELAVDNGFDGTLDEWLDSLKGVDGINGTDGTNGLDGQNAQAQLFNLDLTETTTFNGVSSLIDLDQAYHGILLNYQIDGTSITSNIFLKLGDTLYATFPNNDGAMVRIQFSLGSLVMYLEATNQTTSAKYEVVITSAVGFRF